MENELLLDRNKREARVSLGLSFKDYVWPILFMLSLTMIGLKFPLGYFVALCVLINRFVHDRYDFIIELTLLCGGFSVLTPYLDLFPAADKIIVIVCCLLPIIYKFKYIAYKEVMLFYIYAIILMLFAYNSEESIYIQSSVMVSWLGLCIFIPIYASFGNQRFDFKVFLKRLFPYFIIICFYYIIDSIILSGNFFLPRDNTASPDISFLNLNLYPFSFAFIRMWPMSLYISIPIIYAVTKYYKMPAWQWIVFLIALAVCRTFSLYVALILCWVLSQDKPKKMIKYLGYAIVILVIGYCVDSEPVLVDEDVYESKLRIRSSLDQFTSLANITDDEDLSKFGTNRMLAIIPAFELLYDLNKQWFGVGFLDINKTENQDYYFENELILDPHNPKKVQLINDIESVPIYVLIVIGYVGLIIHCVIFFLSWWYIRKLKYSDLYGIMLICFILLGITGFSGLVGNGLFLCGLFLSAIMLANNANSKTSDVKPSKVK